MESFSLTGLKDSILGLIREHIDLIEPIVFALGFGESLLFVSLFIPSTALFLAIGGLHSAAGGAFLPVWIAGSMGAFLGDIVSYSLGRYFKAEIGGIWPLRDYPEWYVAARQFMKRWGVGGVIVSKFMGAMRPFMPVVAGAMGMRWPSFLFASLVSSFVWAGAFLAPGYGLMWFVS